MRPSRRAGAGGQPVLAEPGALPSPGSRASRPIAWLVVEEGRGEVTLLWLLGPITNMVTQIERCRSRFEPIICVRLVICPLSRPLPTLSK